MNLWNRSVAHIIWLHSYGYESTFVDFPLNLTVENMRPKCNGQMLPRGLHKSKNIASESNGNGPRNRHQNEIDFAAMINLKFTCPIAFGFTGIHIHSMSQSHTGCLKWKQKKLYQPKKNILKIAIYIMLILSTNLVLNTFLMQIDGFFFYQSKYLCFSWSQNFCFCLFRP